MTISLRSVKTLMHSTVPGRKISKDAVLMLKMHLESKAEQLTEKAIRAYDSENLMRKKLGEREKKLIAPRHMIAAIEGRFLDEEKANDED
jgi:hypothetical protein